MKYERDPLLSPRTGMPIDKNDDGDHDIGWEEHQLNMFHDLVTISRGHEVSRPVSHWLIRFDLDTCSRVQKVNFNMSSFINYIININRCVLE